jgi:hypothetical protein
MVERFKMGWEEADRRHRENRVDPLDEQPPGTRTRAGLVEMLNHPRVKGQLVELVRGLPEWTMGDRHD